MLVGNCTTSGIPSLSTPLLELAFSSSMGTTQANPSFALFLLLLFY